MNRRFLELFFALRINEISSYFFLIVTAIYLPYFIIIYSPVYIPVIIKSISENLTDPFAKLLGSILVVVVGILFFKFKDKQQFWYGICETIFAFSSAYLAFDFIDKYQTDKKVEIASFATIVAVIYLIVRGIGNVSSGYDKNNFWLRDKVKKIAPIVSSFDFLWIVIMLLYFSMLVYHKIEGKLFDYLYSILIVFSLIIFRVVDYINKRRRRQ